MTVLKSNDFNLESLEGCRLSIGEIEDILLSDFIYFYQKAGCEIDFLANEVRVVLFNLHVLIGESYITEIINPRKVIHFDEVPELYESLVSLLHRVIVYPL